MKTITYLEFCQVLGLLMLAATHHSSLQNIEAALHKTLGMPEDDWGTHASDAVWSGETDAKRLLRKLGITVEPPTDAVPDLGDAPQQPQ